MRKIVTVTGICKPQDLGFCQFHEHLLLSKGVSFHINSALYMDDIDASTKEAQDYFAAGGNTLIDAQPVGCNRMADGLAEIAIRSGVQIICSTGFHKVQFYPKDHWIFTMSQEDLQSIFVQELTEGTFLNCDTALPIQRSGVKAGMIKCALDTQNLTPQYEKLFRAAAYAAVKTDRTMMVHIEKGSDPLLLADFLQQQGVAPSRLVFCHMDRAIADVSVHQAILKQGIYLESDTIGRFKYHSDETELALLKTYLKAGFEDQLLFSLDTTRDRLRAYNPDAIGLTYIRTVFLEKMQRAGISKEQIQKISNVNCRNVLTC